MGRACMDIGVIIRVEHDSLKWSRFARFVREKLLHSIEDGIKQE